MKRIRIFIYVVVMAIMLCSCADHLSEPTTDMLISDNNAQMFYGTWKVVDIVAGGRFENSEKLKQYIGTELTYGADMLAIDGETAINGPVYSCVLVESVNCTYLFGQNTPENCNNIVDMNSVYFAYVNVKNVLSSALEDKTLLCGFIIRDAQTLVLSTDYGYLRLERVGYPNDYQQYIIGP